MSTHHAQEVGSSAVQTSPGSVLTPCYAPLPVPVPRLSVPQAPVSPGLCPCPTRQASRTLVTVPLSSRGWCPSNAMKGHCDRHLGVHLDGDLPLEWIQSIGHGVREVWNRIPLGVVADARRVGWPSSSLSLALPLDAPTRIRLRSSIPWALGISGVLASTQPLRGGVIVYRDTRTWTDVLILSVPCHPLAGTR